MNRQQAPLDNVNVRWALALSLNLQNVGINSVSGQLRALRRRPWYTARFSARFTLSRSCRGCDFALADGYQPFNEDWSLQLAEQLTQMGVPADQLPQDSHFVGYRCCLVELAMSPRL
ncbi:MAG: hypothetical protein IPK17_35650 [Chloroflexi bacterium]|uniref:hypothetical protein n=1 Tax=Candidatus Flexifilum breve TaxID=3140694 RepID=UPI003136A5EE|nr:hypothetical protein [Chloroflexota bacterium]